MARFWPCGGPIRFSCFQHCWAGLAGLYGPCPFGRHRSLSQTADQGPPAPGEAVGVLSFLLALRFEFPFQISLAPHPLRFFSPSSNPFHFRQFLPGIPHQSPNPQPRRRRRGFNDMGCFLSCFRGRPDHSGGGLQEPLVRGSRLGDAFLDDHADDTTTKLEVGGGTLKEDSGNDGGVDDELRREANYLKSCGAISETPPEILKVSNQIEEEDNNECKDTSNNAQEIKGVTVSEDKEQSSEGFDCDGNSPLSHDQNTGEGADHVGGVESEPGSLLQDKSSCENTRNQKLDSSDSPFPTPLILRGDIQTPGTMFTAYQGNFKSGKRGRTGKQFIYPVLRPIENKLQWMELRDESSPVVASHPPKRRYLCADSTEKPQQTSPSSVATNTEPSESAPFSFHANSKEQAEEVTSPEEHKDQNDNQQLLDDGVGELLKNGSYNEKHGVASLSCWLKTAYGDGGSQCGIGGNAGKQQGFERITDITDVPIFVASGLNWDNDNPTPMLPKAWDGNGIPNTTTKYKEDQRVNWHATPFEERLRKVLSDEKPQHERKISGKLIHLEEDTEQRASHDCVPDELAV